MLLKKRYCYYLLACCLLVFPLSAVAEIAIVVHPTNTSEFSNNYLKKIFLAKTKKFPSGESAVVVDQKSGSDIRKNFLKNLLNKSENQMKAYWSRLIFTGKALPPKEIDSDAEIKKLVNENSSLIGYIDAESVDDSVRVVARF